MSDAQKSAQAVALKAEHPDWGYRTIAAEIGSDRHHVRRWIVNAERKGTFLAVAPQQAVGFYEAARHALAQAIAVDEVKEIRDKALALEAYAKQAKDRELVDKATEIKMRAEIRSGEILRDMEKNQGAVPGKTGIKAQPLLDERRTLADFGLSKSQSSRWQQFAALPAEQQEAKIAKAKRIAVATIDGDKEVLKEVRADRNEEKKAKRATRERVLGGIQHALPTQKFGVILADPEWRFEPWSRTTGMDRAADNHYPTSVTEVIAARDVPSIAADDCVLFLWATVPMLPHALTVMAAWGFDYKSHIIWEKDKVGTGYWFRNKHELLLVGTRGNVPAPAMGDQWSSIIGARVEGHSTKPERFLEMIEAYFPTLPKIELNRRGPARPGWTPWGNEAGEEAA